MDKNKYPNHPDAIAQVSDERFIELTGGLAKSDIHPLMVDIRGTGPGSTQIGDDVIMLQPGNMENGALFPTLDVIGSGVVTTFRSFPGDKLAVDIAQLSDEFDGLGMVQSGISTREGTQVQNESDFALIPQTHWQVLRMARDEIAKRKAERAQRPATKRPGFIRRILGIDK